MVSAPTSSNLQLTTHHLALTPAFSDLQPLILRKQLCDLSIDLLLLAGVRSLIPTRDQLLDLLSDDLLFGLRLFLLRDVVLVVHILDCTLRDEDITKYTNHVRTEGAYCSEKLNVRTPVTFTGWPESFVGANRA